MLSNLRDVLALTRPANVLLAALSILTGALLTHVWQPASAVALACLSGALIVAAGNIMNDVIDVGIDRINKPQRPLPAGRLNASAMLVLSIILFALGVFLSIFINLLSLFISVFAVTSLVAYNVRLKKTCFWGNLTVSFVSALAFLYGASAVGRWKGAVFPALFAFLFHLGREIIKDMEDSRGDMVHAARTLPIVYGRRVALFVVTAIYVLLIATTFLPYWMHFYNVYYLWAVVPGVDLVLVGVIWSLWRAREPAALHRISVVLKADMPVGLLALFIGI